jgi:hypothetical protein
VAFCLPQSSIYRAIHRSHGRAEDVPVSSTPSTIRAITPPMIAKPTSFATRMMIGIAISAKTARKTRPRKQAIECIGNTPIFDTQNCDTQKKDHSLPLKHSPDLRRPTIKPSTRPDATKSTTVARASFVSGAEDFSAGDFRSGKYNEVCIFVWTNGVHISLRRNVSTLGGDPHEKACSQTHHSCPHRRSAGCLGRQSPRPTSTAAGPTHFVSGAWAEYRSGRPDSR